MTPNIQQTLHKEENINPFTEKQIKILIMYYLFYENFKKKIGDNVLSKEKSECYLINEDWMNIYKEF